MSIARPAVAPGAPVRTVSGRGLLVCAAAVVVCVVTAVVGASAVSAGAPQIAVRAAAQALLGVALAVVLGGTLTAARTPLTDPLRGRLLDLAAVAAGAQTVLSAVTAFLLYLGTAPSPGDPAFGPGLVAFVADVPVGRSWGIAAAGAAVLTALLVAVRSRDGVAVLWAASGLAALPAAVQVASSGGSLGVVRGAAGAAFVVLVAGTTWAGTAGLRTAGAAPRSRGVAVASTGAVLVAVLAGWRDLVAVGLGPGAMVAAVAVAVVAAGAAILGAPAVQTVLLGAALGLGASVSATRALPDVPTRTTPAEILTGAPLPPTPTPWTLVASWRPDPFWLVVCAALLMWAAVSARRSGARWPVRRMSSWGLGVLLLAWLTSGGPAVYGEVLFGAHLARLVALVLVVPLLLLGGTPPRRAAVSARARLARRGNPVLAGVVAVLVVLLAESGPVLRWSLTDPVGAEATLAAALLAGAWLVRAVAVPADRRRAAVATAAVLAVLELVGAALLATGSSLVLADWFGAMGWGADAVAAQRASSFAVLPIALVPTLVLLVLALRARSGARAGAGAGAVTA